MWGFQPIFNLGKLRYKLAHWKQLGWSVMATSFTLVFILKLLVNYFWFFLFWFCGFRLSFPEENNNSLKKIPKLEDPAQNYRLGLVVWSFGLYSLSYFISHDNLLCCMSKLLFYCLLWSYNFVSLYYEGSLSYSLVYFFLNMCKCVCIIKQILALTLCFWILQPRRADLDMNQHVNNVTYIGWLLEVVR